MRLKLCLLFLGKIKSQLEFNATFFTGKLLEKEVGLRNMMESSFRNMDANYDAKIEDLKADLNVLIEDKVKSIESQFGKFEDGFSKVQMGVSVIEDGVEQLQNSLDTLNRARKKAEVSQKARQGLNSSLYVADFLLNDVLKVDKGQEVVHAMGMVSNALLSSGVMVGAFSAVATVMPYVAAAMAVISIFMNKKKPASNPFYKVISKQLEVINKKLSASLRNQDQIKVMLEQLEDLVTEEFDLIKDQLSDMQSTFYAYTWVELREEIENEIEELAEATSALVVSKKTNTQIDAKDLSILVSGFKKAYNADYTKPGLTNQDTKQILGLASLRSYPHPWSRIGTIGSEEHIFHPLIFSVAAQGAYEVFKSSYYDDLSMELNENCKRAHSDCLSLIEALDRVTHKKEVFQQMENIKATLVSLLNEKAAEIQREADRVWLKGIKEKTSWNSAGFTTKQLEYTVVSVVNVKDLDEHKLALNGPNGEPYIPYREEFDQLSNGVWWNVGVVGEKIYDPHLWAHESSIKPNPLVEALKLGLLEEREQEKSDKYYTSSVYTTQVSRHGETQKKLWGDRFMLSRYPTVKREGRRHITLTTRWIQFRRWDGYGHLRHVMNLAQAEINKHKERSLVEGFNVWKNSIEKSKELDEQLYSLSFLLSLSSFVGKGPKSRSIVKFTESLDLQFSPESLVKYFKNSIKIAPEGLAIEEEIKEGILTWYEQTQAFVENLLVNSPVNVPELSASSQLLKQIIDN